jgi:hypothetical protein
MRRAYLCVTIDTESDKGPGWRVRRPLSFVGVTDGVTRRLAPLFKRFGAKATYLLSPEVLRDARSVEALRAVDGSSELGTHLHGEFAEPNAHVPDVTAVFQRDYPAEVEAQKLAYLTQLFVDGFGRSPRSFRAGRFGIGPSSLGILESLGYTVDSSVTPHMDWSGNGAPGLAFLKAPTQPYFPDRRNPENRGNANILEVPVTIRRRWRNAIPLVGRAFEPRWLRPTHGSQRSIVRVARDEIAAHPMANNRPVILNAMFHNVEVVPGLSPYAANERQAAGILGRLEALLEFAQRCGIAVVGLSDVPEILGA